MKHRTLAAIAVVAGIAIGTAACSTNTGPAESGVDTLNILAGSEVKPALDAAIAKFEQENPDVTISASYNEQSALTSVIPTQLAAGTAPDMFTTWPGLYSQLSAGTLGRRDFLVDLSGEAWVQELPDQFEDYVGADGKVYFPPLTGLAIITMYNQTTLDELGLSIPTTWSEVLQFCDDATAAGVTAYALGAQTDWQNQMVPFSMVPTLVNREYPDFSQELAAGETTFADSGWLEVFEQVQELNDRGCFGASPTGTAVDVALSQVAQHEALGAFTPSSVYNSLKSQAPDDEIVATSFPATNNADDTRMAIAVGNSLSINAKSPAIELGKRFIAFLMEEENMNAWAEATGQLPALQNDSFVPTPAIETAVQYQSDDRTFLMPDQLFPGPKVKISWIEGSQEMLSRSGTTPQDIVDRMLAAFKEKQAEAE